MRRKSIKRQALEASADPIRDQYRFDHPWCAICETRPATDLHEITRGWGNRAISYDKPATWLRLCRWCHNLCDDYEVWPPAKQLAIKMLVDPDLYDLDIVNECRTGKISQEEVDYFIQELTNGQIRHTRPGRNAAGD